MFLVEILFLVVSFLNIEMTKKIYLKDGFALLYAILLTGAVLVVGVILMNIITKQLVFSSLSRDSEVSYYYVANSGRECLQYYVNKRSELFYTSSFDDETGQSSYAFSDQVNIVCFNDELDQPQTITLTKDSVDLIKPIYSSSEIIINDNGSNRKVKLSVQFNENCLPANPAGCSGSNLIDTAKAVMISEGYSSGSLASRTTRRVAISVNRPI